jgi:hypothetical protein
MSSMPSAVSKILLVSERTRTGGTRPSPVLKRYRLARLQLEPRPVGAARHAHLRRSYD